MEWNRLSNLHHASKNEKKIKGKRGGEKKQEVNIGKAYYYPQSGTTVGKQEKHDTPTARSARLPFRKKGGVRGSKSDPSKL